MPSRREFKSKVKKEFDLLINECNCALHSFPLLHEIGYKETLRYSEQAKMAICSRISALKGDLNEKDKNEFNQIKSEFIGYLNTAKNKLNSIKIVI